MSQALYRKWRPQRWEQVIGQEHIILTLRNSVAADRIAHAYLFAGPRGTGKTTTARLLAKAVDCLDPELSARPCDRCDHCQAINQGRFLDLIEIDAASNTSVEDVRDLRDKINFAPNQGRYKVYIVDEVHMLSTAAFNALLKTLEEPPSHAMFILATTEVHRIPATVLSRCQRHEFRRIPVAEIVNYLGAMATDEGIDIEPEALTVIARQATGSLRDAISLLDQLASAHQKITLSLAQEILGTATSQAVLDLVEALIAADGTTGLLVIHRTLDAGTDARQFARQIVEYLRSLLLVTYGNVSQVETTTELRAQMARHVQDYDLAHLLVAIQTFNRAAVEARGNWQPALPLEMALMEALTPRLPQTSQAFAPSPAHEQKPAAKEAGVRMEAGMYLQAGTPHNDPGAAQVKPGTARTKDSQPEPDRPSAQDVSTSHLLGEVWPGLLAKVREINPKTYGLLNSARTRAMHGNVLHLGFASDLLTSQMERSNDAQMVRQVLSELMGMEVVLRCYTVSGKQTAPPPDVDSDGIVAAALRDLGGEIVDIQ